LIARVRRMAVRVAGIYVERVSPIREVQPT
jgi:hypothetical protein